MTSRKTCYMEYCQEEICDLKILPYYIDKCQNASITYFKPFHDVQGGKWQSKTEDQPLNNKNLNILYLMKTQIIFLYARKYVSFKSE